MATVVGLRFQDIPLPVGNESVIAVGGEEGQLGAVRGFYPADDERTSAASGSLLKGEYSITATSATPSILFDMDVHSDSGMASIRFPRFWFWRRVTERWTAVLRQFWITGWV